PFLPGVRFCPALPDVSALPCPVPRGRAAPHALPRTRCPARHARALPCPAISRCPALPLWDFPNMRDYSWVYAHPSTVFSCLVVPSDSSGSTEGGDPAAADTATSRRSPRLETPTGSPPLTSSPPLQPVAVDFGGPGVVGGGDDEGAGSGGSGSRGADSGSARSPLFGGLGGTGSGGALQSLPQRPIFLEQPLSSLPELTPTRTTPPLSFPPPGLSRPLLLSDSLLPALARYSPLPISLTGRRVLPVVLPLPPPSSFPAVPDHVSDLARAARPTIPCCLAALVTAPASSTAAASALVAELAGFAATCRHAYLAGLVSAYPLRILRPSEVSLPLAVMSVKSDSSSWSTCRTLSVSGLATLRTGDTTLRIGGLLGGCCATWPD
ncbi:unnamed protein product, partial [Closterium sp. NIES-54]